MKNRLSKDLIGFIKKYNANHLRMDEHEEKELSNLINMFCDMENVTSEQAFEMVADYE